MFKAATRALAGRTLTGCVMSSPVDVFNRCNLPSLEIVYTDVGPPMNAFAFAGPAAGAAGAPPRAPAGGAGTGITGMAVSPPGQPQVEAADCGSDTEYSRCFCQNILPRSASIA